MSTDIQLIRDAAEHIRTYATEAAPSPWTGSLVWSPDATSTSGIYSHSHPTGTVESEVVASGRVRAGYGGIRNPLNARHIAAWHPAVALAVADWLDLEAAMAEKRGNSADGHTFHAMAVAHAFMDPIAARATVPA